MNRRQELQENCEYVVLERFGNCFLCRNLAEARDVVHRALEGGTSAEDLAVTAGNACFSVWAVIFGVYVPRKMPEWVEEWGWEEC